MSQASRVSLGHALIGLGLLLRRLTGVLAGLLFVVVLAGVVLEFLFPRASPALPGEWIGTGPREISTHVLFVLLAIVLLLLGGRLFAVGLAALGWIVFPSAHRSLLSHIAAAPRL